VGGRGGEGEVAAGYKGAKVANIEANKIKAKKKTRMRKNRSGWQRISKSCVFSKEKKVSHKDTKRSKAEKGKGREHA